MTDENRVQPNYQEMADARRERPNVDEAVSATQQQLLEMPPGERWAHEAAQRVQRVGGNQGDFTLEEAGRPADVTDNTQLPERIQQGITTKYPVTDRNLDVDGEEGYPTPT